ncbi:MAG: TlpA family protein disulfide reductase [Phycisphaerales bacterium]|nr:TlpA family protein disulfide reductase [Phycisphaerales bacterium]
MNARLALAALLLAAGNALAFTPPTDDQVAAAIDRVNAIKPPDGADAAARAATMKARNDAAKEGLAALSLPELSVPQAEKLINGNMFVGNPDAAKAVSDRIAELAKADTPDGARAAEIRLTPAMLPPVSGATQEDRAKSSDARKAALVALYVQAVKHPATPASIKAGKGEILFANFASLPTPAIKEHNLVPAIERLAASDLSIEAAAALGAAVSKLGDKDLALSKPELTRILDTVAASAQAAVDRAGSAPAGKEATLKRATDTVKRAKSGFARGEFLDRPAPAVPFDWSSDGKLKNIAELKGNVVVLDFWATWCGPCVASFPNIRDLVARYDAAGSPVRVIGVTSPQGFHMQRSLEAGAKSQRIDCKENPQKEYELMPQFMKDMNMTWTVGFTPDGCFNPNFGVNGIPHLAIIDAEGKVRYNGLHPMHAKDVADKIDALLKEANLKAPAEPMAAPEQKDEKKVSAK